MIDFEKKLEDALREIECTCHDVFSPTREDLNVLLIYTSYLYPTTPLCFNMLIYIDYPYDPLIDFCCDSSTNVYDVIESIQGEYHFWMGKQGYIFAAKKAKPTLEKIPETPGLLVNARDIFPQNKLYPDRLDINRKDITIFFDNPSEVSMVYFMRKIPLIEQIAQEGVK